MKVTVKFARGRQELYNLFTPQQKQSIVYFAEDTNEIYVRDIAYGINLNSQDIDLVSKVETSSIGALKFTMTNGKTVSLSIPEATNMTAGLMSAADKQALDDIPNVYATKEELAAQTSKVYRFKGTKQFFEDLPTEGQKQGDTYNILNPFDHNGKHYSGGTNVAWDGSDWDELGGIFDGYTKEEADTKFVAWSVDTNGVKSIVLPKGGKLLGTTQDNLELDTVKLSIYDSGVVQKVELGNELIHTHINSSDRPTVNSEYVAYLSDIGYIDTEKYGSTYTTAYIPKLTQDYLDNLPTQGDNLDGEPITNTHKPLVGQDYLLIFYNDTLAQVHIDWFTPESTLPNAVYAAIQGLREEYLDMFTWEEVGGGSTPEQRTNTQTIIDALNNGDSAVSVLEGTTKDIVIPEGAKAGATVTVNLDENSTLQTSKRVTLVNNSDTPANLTITTSEKITVTLKGKYDVVITKASVTVTDGSVNQVIIPENAINAITVNTQIAESLTVSSSSSADLTISGNTNPNADLIIVAPSATVTLNGTYDKVTSTTANNTLIIGQAAHMNKLVVRKGNVIVNDIDVYNRIGMIVNDTEYTVECRTNDAADWQSFKSAATKQGITNVTQNIVGEGSGIQFGVLASGNYKWNFGSNDVTCGFATTGSFFLRGSAHVEIYSSGRIVNNAESYGLWLSGGSADIYGGQWEAYTHVLYCEKGSINVYGGTFKCLSEDKKFTLNCLDKNYTAGTAKITVYGGTFYGFNPGASMSEPGGPVSFLAEGKKSVEISQDVYQVIDE